MSVQPVDPGLQQFIENREQLLAAAPDEAHRAHFQAELDLVRSWGTAPGVETSTPGQAPEDDTQLPGPGVDDDEDVDTEFSGDFKGTLPPQLEPYRDMILQASADTGVPAQLIAAQILQESNGDPAAVSVNPQMGTTDRGLMQVSQAVFTELQQNYPEVFGGRTHAEIGTDPELAIMAGAYHMKDLHAEFGDWDVALRGYVSGTTGINVNDANDSSYSPGTDPNYVALVKAKVAQIG